MITNKFIKNLKQYPRHGAARGPAGYGEANLGGGGFESDMAPAPPFPGLAPSGVAGGAAVNAPGLIQELAQGMAQQIIAEQQATQTITLQGKTFTIFNAVNDIVDNQTEIVTAGLWSDNTAELTAYYTSSTQSTSQRRYYVNVYQKSTSLTGSAVQFALAYGNALGYGSSNLGSEENPASKAVYGQYKQLLLNPSETRFSIITSGSTDSIYVVNFERNRMKEKIDVGNWELPLTTIASRDSNATGSVTLTTGTYTLIDDSTISSGSVGDSGFVYNIVSGSIDSGVYNPTAPHYYGLTYPDHGVLIVDGDILDAKLAFDTNISSDSEGDNHFAMYHSISGSYANATKGFAARNQEKVTSTHYFCRIKNAEYNFSNNPSYVTGSVGLLAQSTFINNPRTYITTIGLYNSNNELLAVAKLSQPLLKSFQREALVRVKLDY